ncbi:MAG: NPCBM/NEW2 domain-containing protein [Fimbriimonadaceae bacterium]
MLTFLFLHSLQAGTVRLEDLDLSHITQDWGTPQRNKSVDGHFLSVHGQRFELGIGTHAVSRFEIGLGGKATYFSAKCGVDDEATPRGSVSFEIWVDGKRRAATAILHKGQGPAALSIPLQGARRLTLVVTDGGDGNDNDHADWLEPIISTVPGGERFIKPFSPPPEPMPQIAHGFGPKPQINGAHIVGCTAGHDFIYRIPATGTGPLVFRAEGLPAGLTLDSTNGVIRGKVGQATRTAVQITVTGPRGKDSRVLFIDSRGQLALTPPMGWNSWNVWARAVNQARVLDAAHAFVSTGLASYGYNYVNIDDTWEGSRGRDGIITTNSKFPDMKGLAESIHALGLHLGIYSSPGPETCAGFPASYKHEEQDADTYAKWGIDYLKYDWCSYGSIAPNPDLAALEKPYALMHDKLVHSGRDIVFSLCQYGMGNVWNWGASVGGNVWRCTGDINDSWSSMSGIAFQGDKWAKGGGPGHWNDPDMLVVGRLGWGDHPHPTRLTPNEQMTHITMWAMQAAPLLIGCDLTHIDRFTLDLLTNHDVIEVDQDMLGKPATRIAQNGETEVWARPLAAGGYAVALFNRGEDATRVTFRFSDLGLTGSHQVRDLWRMRNVGRAIDAYSATVARHGAVLLSVK